MKTITECNNGTGTKIKLIALIPPGKSMTFNVWWCWHSLRNNFNEILIVTFLRQPLIKTKSYYEFAVKCPRHAYLVWKITVFCCFLLYFSLQVEWSQLKIWKDCINIWQGFLGNWNPGITKVNVLSWILRLA
jgi:hypothetical protein